MKRLVAILITSCLATLTLAACGSKAPSTGGTAGKKPTTAPPVEIIVSVAGSLTSAMSEIKNAFEADNPTIKVRFNFGSSGALQQQIERGAPVDLFVSAASAPLDSLVAKGLVWATEVKALVTNQVILVRGTSAGESVKRWEDLAGSAVTWIAIGNPAHVPAGQYSKAVLETLNLWGTVQRRLVLGEDARQVLNYVESGEVQAGIVYRTDAAGSQKIVVVAEAPIGSHPSIIYPMAVLKDSKSPVQASAFADYLLSPKGMDVLLKYGFGKAN